MYNIQSDRRKSGISVIGDVPWGTSFCQFYQTKKDVLDIFVPYFTAGLKNNELCVWVTSDFLPEQDALRALKKALPHFEKYAEKGQIEIVPYSRWSGKGGKDGKAVVSRLDKAVSVGFDGLRLGFNAFPQKKGGRSVASYGDADAISGYNALAVFAYPRDEFDAIGLMEVVKNHRFALVRNAGAWEVIESSEARIAKDELRRTEEKLHSLFGNMAEGFVYSRIVLDGSGKPCDFVFLEVNDAFEKLIGLKGRDVIGKRVTQALPGIENDPTDWIGKYGQVAMTGKPARFESYSELLKRWYSVSAFSPRKGFFAVTFSDITEQKQAEEKLAYLASYPELNPLFVSEMDLLGNPTYLNPATRKRFPDLEMKGDKHPYFAGLKEAVQSQRQSGSGNIVREVAVDGRHYQQFIAVLAEGKRVRIYGLDVTERKLAEEELARKSEDLAATAQEWVNTFDSINDGISIHSLDFRIMRANRALAEMLGNVPLETIIGQPCYRLVHGLNEPIENCPLAHYKSCGKVIEIVRQEPHLGNRWLQVRCDPVRGPDGNLVSMVHVVRDITDLKNKEETIQQKAQELARSNAELEQFAYVASHDLQEPLRMVSSYVQLLRNRYRGKLDPDADDFISYAHDGASRMQQLISDLLRYSRAGTRGKEFHTVDLEGVFVQAVENLKLAIVERSARLTHDPLPRVLGDSGQLTQVFQNLIENGMKFHGDDTPHIHVAAEIKGDECICSVRDNGIGIAPEYSHKLFKLFQRLHNRSEYPGTGIGLALCKRIVERHGGRIWGDSQPGEGSTFYFAIPAARA